MRLRKRLSEVNADHGLDRRQLLQTQRAVASLVRSGVVPPANEFWETTALPRAQQLVQRSRTVVDEELALLADQVDVQRFQWEVDIDLFLGSVPGHDDIDELGRWWQRRLRRVATMRALPLVLARKPSETELAVSHMEMALLDQAPWSHGDRLLSAFEVARREIRHYAHRRLGEIGRRRFPPATSTPEAGRFGQQTRLGNSDDRSPLI